MHKSLVLGVATAIMVSGSAMAADIGARIPTKAPPVMAPVWSWNGFYLGVNAGYGFGNDSGVSTTGQAVGNVQTVADGARAPFVPLERDGFLGGAQIGYNWQTGGFVFGLEADIQYTDFKDSVNAVTTGVLFPGVRNNNFSHELEYLGTARGRIGYAFDRTLFYVTGGLAYGGVKSEAAFFSPQPGNVLQFAGTTDELRTGYTVGGGIEHAFWQNWSAKIEYLYYDLGDTTVAVNRIATAVPLGIGTGYDSTFRNDGHIVRAGLNFRFGGGDPIMARY